MTVYQTKNNTNYLKSPQVHVISRPNFLYNNLTEFLDSFGPAIDFSEYLEDFKTSPTGPAGLAKFAGQLCYLSLGHERTYNKDAQRYFQNIITSKHGSVLEHINYSFLIFGISRSLTHELVRHRAGCGYSQVSQRYVDGSKLRFVERPEYQNNPELHAQFETRIDSCAAQYATTTAQLLDLQSKGNSTLSGDSKRELRKRVQSCSRSVLSNEVEAPMVFTANIRALRHIINMRCSRHAEIEIRTLFNKVFEIMMLECPLLFQDFSTLKISDNTLEIQSQYA